MPKNSPAKARAMRLPLDSFSHDRLATVRNWCTGVALLAGIGWLFFAHSDREGTYSPGPISEVHAQYDCECCHDGDAPMQKNTFLSFLVDKKNQKALWDSKTDLLCRSCHPVAGDSDTLAQNVEFSNREDCPKIDNPVYIFPHSANQKPSEVETCAGCHSEHKGLDHSPLVVSDEKCINCHRDIDSFRITGENGIKSNITKFEKETHPDFESLATDKGTLKFNHALHMSAGIAGPDANPKLIKRLSNIGNHDGTLNSFVNDKGEIQLDCNFCHQSIGDSAQLVSTDSTGLSLSGGKYMSMPNYEQHCRACHPIGVTSTSSRFVDNVKKDADKQAEFEDFSIPHGIAGDEVTRFLKVLLALELGDFDDETRSEIALRGLDAMQALPTRLWNKMERKLGSDEKMQRDFGTAIKEITVKCNKCHLQHDNATALQVPDIKKMELDHPSQTGTVFNITWLRKGKFDHSSHRDIQCVRCHQVNEGKTGMDDLSLDKPMITGLSPPGSQRESSELKYCIDCHTDKKVEQPFRASTTDCTKCHTYHGGGHRIK